MRGDTETLVLCAGAWFPELGGFTLTETTVIETSTLAVKTD